MFKLAVLAAVLAVAVAAPGGLTGVPFSYGHGAIVAPNVISHAPAVAAHVVAQPVAPIVHAAPIVTRTVLPSHGSLLLGGHGLSLHG
ncbi:uncharacterized protein LOC105701140 [Orussus abietinus]|uniref:uncharacterized protein LOC105701140 n=1 Tax=Orussus abietinus TaxID=222816 RepID=UPI000626B5FA|nr:uncharacterized protein LOC105701140 [Orussus abietinus]